MTEKMYMTTSLWTIVSIAFVLSCCKIDQRANAQCIRSPPTIVGYSRPKGISASSYKFTWRLERCNTEDIVQYQVQFTGSCSTTPPVTVSTRSNETSTVIDIPSCAERNCYVRVRAELIDGSFTDYSACVLINHHFFEHRKFIEQYFREVCVPIQGLCRSGAVSEFFINGDLTLRPEPTSLLYNVTVSSQPALRSYNFCFKNITDDVVITEFCYQDHAENCSLCTVEFGEITFQSHSEISIETQTRPKPNSGSNTTKMYSSSITWSPFSRTKSHNDSVNMTGESLLIIMGAVSISILCIIIGVILLIILWCKKKPCLCLRKSKQGNIYDEPSLPDPIYQELNVGSTSKGNVEMMGNDAYNYIAQKASESDLNTALEECPAYIKHQDMDTY